MYKIALLLFVLAFIISCSDDEGSTPRAFFFVFQIVDEYDNDFFHTHDEYENPIDNLLFEIYLDGNDLSGAFEKCLLPDSTLRIYSYTSRPKTTYLNYGNGDIDTLYADYEFDKKSDEVISSAEFCLNQEPCIKIDLDIANRKNYRIGLSRFCTDTTIIYPLIKLIKR